MLIKEMDVYKKTMELAVEVSNKLDLISGRFRVREQFVASLTSICANLAEMQCMESEGSRKQKIQICIGEAYEAQTWCEFFYKTRLINESEYSRYNSELISILKMLFGFRKIINSKESNI